MLAVVRFSITVYASSRHHEITGHCHQNSFLISQAHTDHLKITITWTIFWLFVFLRHRNFLSPKAVDLTLNITVLQKWDLTMAYLIILVLWGRLKIKQNSCQPCVNTYHLKHTDLQAAAAAVEIMKTARHFLFSHHLLSHCSSRGPPTGWFILALDLRGHTKLKVGLGKQATRSLIKIWGIATMSEWKEQPEFMWGRAWCGCG